MLSLEVGCQLPVAVVELLTRVFNAKKSTLALPYHLKSFICEVQEQFRAGIVHLATYRGALLGAMAIYPGAGLADPHFSRTDRCRVSKLYLCPSTHQHAIATAMFDCVERYLKYLGKRSVAIKLEMADGMQRAHFEGMGFLSTYLEASYCSPAVWLLIKRLHFKRKLKIIGGPSLAENDIDHTDCDQAATDQQGCGSGINCRQFQTHPPVYDPARLKKL